MARKFKDDFRESPKADDSLTASVRHVRDELLSIIEKDNLESIEYRWVKPGNGGTVVLSLKVEESEEDINED